MKDYNPKELLISQHIPKCGGVSFDIALKKWFGVGLFRHYYNHKKNRPSNKLYKAEILQKILPICIHGHFDAEKDKRGIFEYYPSASQFITVVREPLEMQLSMYFYMKKLIEQKVLFWQGKQVSEMKYGGDIDAWVEQRPLYLLRFLPFELTKDNFEEKLNKYFVHIGITEDLQQSTNIIADKLGKNRVGITQENFTERSLKPSEEAVRRFKNKHILEYEIYNFAVNLNLK